MGALLKIVQPPTVVAQESACRVLNALTAHGAAEEAAGWLESQGYCQEQWLLV